jgi:hypothetical protein
LRKNLLTNQLKKDTEWRIHKRMLAKQEEDDMKALINSLQGTGQMSMRTKEMRNKSLLVLEDIFRSCKFITRPEMLYWESSLGERIRSKLMIEGLKQDKIWTEFCNQFRRDHKEKVWSTITAIGKKVKGKSDKVVAHI